MRRIRTPAPGATLWRWRCVQAPAWRTLGRLLLLLLVLVQCTPQWPLACSVYPSPTAQQDHDKNMADDPSQRLTKEQRRAAARAERRRRLTILGKQEAAAAAAAAAAAGPQAAPPHGGVMTRSMRAAARIKMVGGESVGCLRQGVEQGCCCSCCRPPGLTHMRRHTLFCVAAGLSRLVRGRGRGAAAAASGASGGGGGGGTAAAAAAEAATAAAATTAAAAA